MARAHRRQVEHTPESPSEESWAHRFFELSENLLAVLDADGRILQANRAWSALMGGSHESLIGASYQRFLHPANREVLEPRLRALVGTDGRIAFTCRWRCQEGSWRWLSWNVVSSARDGLLYCTARPLEVPRLTEEAEASRATSPGRAAGPVPLHMLRPWGLSDSLPLGLYAMELHSGRVLHVNRQFCQLAGVDALEEVIRRGELTHAQLLQRLPAPYAEALFREQAAPPGGASSSELEEVEVVLADGRTLRRLSTPLRNAAGVAICQLHLFEDITARKRVEQALHRSGLSFRKLIEGAPDGLFVHRERRFIYVNPALLKALGYEHERELIGQPIWNIVHPDDREMVRQRVHVAADLRQLAPLREVRYLRRNGTWYYAESTGLPVEFDGAEAVVVIARDITERKRMQAQLLQNDRMALVGTLAAGVGHEINNPLTYVLANLGLALEALEPLSGEEEASLPRELKELLQEAHEGAARVRNIVRDLKSFSRQEEEERRTAVDMREVLDFSIKMATSELRHRAQLHKRYEPVPAVHADASRLGQVFLNLLMNAAQAIPEGNTANNSVTVWIRQEASGRVAVDVSDTGSGMPPEVLARIFDPFFTTKPVGVGTGLGLSICYGIIKSLGGEISVRSEVGRGTTFTVVLPAMTSEETGVQAPAAREDRAGCQGRMLVIDNEPLVGRSLARLIGSRHQVTVVGSGQEGLARLASGESFDVIFCDLLMPDITGMDVYERVRESRPDLLPRFIFITGGSYTPRASQFLETVPGRWIEKPFDVKQLQGMIEKLLMKGTPGD